MPNKCSNVRTKTANISLWLAIFVWAVPATNSLVVPQSATISKISPDFCAIYAQAEEVDQRGLVLVAGPGYRKALEFLIKDYIVGEFTEKGKELATKRASVEKTPQLGTCIANYIKSDQIREITKRAT